MDSTALRSRTVRLLLAATLLTALILGVVAVMASRANDAPTPSAGGVPLTDDQSRQQVLESARQFAGAGKMKALNATYLLASCTSEEQPPYQGLVYLNFYVPTVAETRAYFKQISDAMVTRGWHEGLPPGNHPGGRSMAKDGSYAVFYRDPDLPGRGLLKIYGECRNVTDHSQDSIGFVDVTVAVQR